MLQSVVAPIADDLHQRNQCEPLGLSRETCIAILIEVGQKYLREPVSDSEARAFFAGLHTEELILARACAAGNEHAWEIFLTRYREKLYVSALRIAREDSSARELADSLYADLYATRVRDGERASKLTSYTGRGSLEGWLRAVLAQEYVNRYRKTRRTVSLEEEVEEGSQFAAPEAEPEVPADSRLESATDEALSALSGEERTILAAYFLDDRTLADIGRMLRVHESTISRKLERLTKALRKQIVASLCRRGMSRRQAEEAMEADVRDIRLDIRKSLSQEVSGTPFSGRGHGSGPATAQSDVEDT
jgi:RNA polymerase sigma-70 factor (ECF subfamily)